MVLLLQSSVLLEPYKTRSGLFYPVPSSNQKNKIINGAAVTIIYIIHTQRNTYGILYCRIVLRTADIMRTTM